MAVDSNLLKMLSTPVDYTGQIEDHIANKNRDARLQQAYGFLQSGKPVEDSRSYIMKALGGDTGAIDSEQAALETIRRYDPKQYDTMVQRSDKLQKEERERIKEENVKRQEAWTKFAPIGHKMIGDIMSVKDIHERAELVRQQAETVSKAIGIPAEELIESMDEEHELSDKNLRKLRLGFAAMGGQPDPLSTAGKIQRDVENGLLTADAAAKAMEKTPLVQTILPKERDKKLAEREDLILEAGDAAVQTNQSVMQLRDLLLQGTQTGRFQDLILPLKGFADDLGWDMSAAEEAAGLKFDELANQEEFNRLATELVINGFEKFKGNLNAQEVRLAISAFPGLGTSEDGNKMALASLWAAAQLAADDAAAATEAEDDKALRKVLSRRFERSDGAEFEKLRKHYLNWFYPPTGTDITQAEWDRWPTEEKQAILDELRAQIQ